MAKSNEYVTTLLRVMVPLGDVSARNMFGGHGLFFEGSMFALVTRKNDLFFRADDINRPDYEKRDLKPFGRMPYFAAPPECADGWRKMKPWAKGAVDAALRARAAKTPKKPRKKR